MSTPPPVQPVVFEPLFVEKPWGGRMLATLLDKRLPAGTPIGESWELADLPEAESCVREGPLRGTTLGELCERWGDALLGSANLGGDGPQAGRSAPFPLLVKFLDARQNLSVQVHPKPGADDPLGLAPGIKHECWYVLHAELGARLYIGLKPGVTPADVERAAGSPVLVDLLDVWTPKAGDAYMLPSGTLHALGAGVVVAEFQTPSDITYRAYDWERVDASGRPRGMHVSAALANIRYDITREDICRLPETSVGSARYLLTELVRGARFAVSHCQPLDDKSLRLRDSEMRVLVVTQGSFTLTGPLGESRYKRGDVVLIPAAATGLRVERATSAEWLEATVPADPEDGTFLRPKASGIDGG